MKRNSLLGAILLIFITACAYWCYRHIPLYILAQYKHGHAVIVGKGWGIYLFGWVFAIPIALVSACITLVTVRRGLRAYYAQKTVQMEQQFTNYRARLNLMLEEAERAKDLAEVQAKQQYEHALMAVMAREEKAAQDSANALKLQEYCRQQFEINQKKVQDAEQTTRRAIKKNAATHMARRLKARETR